MHFLIVGWGPDMIDELARRIARKSGDRFSYIVHPREVAEDFAGAGDDALHFFRGSLRDPLPAPDHELLASLEQEGIPTIHNMIMGDRVVAKLEYADALRYATFLARRFRQLFEEIRPDAIIGNFDALHSSLGLAIARRMNIPWFAMNFSVVPPGLACYCDGILPTCRVQLSPADWPAIRARANELLAAFEARRVIAPAYVTPPTRNLASLLRRLPVRINTAFGIMRKARLREFIKFTQERSEYSVLAALRHLYDARRAARATGKLEMLTEPPAARYVMFGLHLQPESSIDVWAPFFSNQPWVVELLARAIPASHRLLIKIHKSDAAKYSEKQLRQLASLPGVLLVHPFADTRRFIDHADMLFSIQGTMGLEAALLGKPVIMLGDSPVAMFPSAARVGVITALPELIRAKLAQPIPPRASIVDAYANFLSPFMPARHNDWTVPVKDSEIDSFVVMFDRLRDYLLLRVASQVRTAT